MKCRRCDEEFVPGEYAVAVYRCALPTDKREYFVRSDAGMAHFPACPDAVT